MSPGTFGWCAPSRCNNCPVIDEWFSSQPCIQTITPYDDVRTFWPMPCSSRAASAVMIASVSPIAPLVSPITVPGITGAESGSPIIREMPLRTCAYWSVMRLLRSGPSCPNPFASA